jgi:hypothetical protein
MCSSACFACENIQKVFFSGDGNVAVEWDGKDEK